MLFNTIKCAYKIFNTYISKHEAKFIKVVKQKQTLIGLCEKHITNVDYFIDHLIPCEVCGCEGVTNVMRSLSCFPNIRLKKDSTNKSKAMSIANISDQSILYNLVLYMIKSIDVTGILHPICIHCDCG